MQQPFHGLVNDIQRQRHQGQRVHERRQHPRAMIPEGLGIVGRLELQIEAEGRQNQRQGVGEVVPGVRDQRQAA